MKTKNKQLIGALLLSTLAACGGGTKDGSATYQKSVIPLSPKGTTVTTVEEKQEAAAEGVDIYDWFNKDPELDGIMGVSTNRVYAEMDIRNDIDPIIVAVVDSGVDIYHEDLQGKIWTNPNEIPDNGIDDDNNGFIDDIHGWNFIGGHDENGNPTHVGADTLELTREYARMTKLAASNPNMSDEDKAYLEKLTEEFNAAAGSAIQIMKIARANFPILQAEFGIEDVSSVSIADLQSDKAEVQAAISQIKQLLSMFRAGIGLVRIMDYYGDQVDYYYNVDFDPRKTIVKDDPTNLQYLGYGNNDVKGPDSSHGTHVSGIIAAVRNNGIGMNGVAENVRIMSVRVVPNGDERDKDVANGIRYAVDNGARVINCSFGKAFSPQKKYVDDAIKYAAQKGVLVLAAAGNDNLNVEINPHYPLKRYVEGGESDSYMTIGASSYLANLNLPAYFSNYGKQTVDLFAPGYQIFSTTPENNYEAYNGTSMATPVTAGVAALVLSQYPEITGKQLRDILMYSVVEKKDLEVRLPGSDTFDVPIPFADISVTGGIVNAKKALELAKRLKEEQL